MFEASSLFAIALDLAYERKPDTQSKVVDSTCVSILGCLDLFVCFMIHRIMFNPTSGQQILMDRTTNQCYFVLKNILNSATLRAQSSIVLSDSSDE
jgi:hypothetical protein